MSVDEIAVIPKSIQSAPLLSPLSECSDSKSCMSTNTFTDERNNEEKPTTKLAQSIGKFINKVTNATNAVIEGTSLSGCVITPVSVINENGSVPYITPTTSNKQGNRNHISSTLHSPPSLQYQKNQSLQIHQGAIRSIAAAAACRHHSQPAEMFVKVFQASKKDEEHIKSINHHLKSAVLMDGAQDSIKCLRDLVEDNGVCSTRVLTSVVISKRIAARAEEAISIAKNSILLKSNLDRSVDIKVMDQEDINKVENERNEILRHIREADAS